MNNQRGLNTLMLGIGLGVAAVLGFIAFKLLIEPPRQSAKEVHESPKPSGLMLNITAPTPNSSVLPTLKNPASENCIEKGGNLSIMKNGSGAEFGLCRFEDDKACEEWALMRGDCPSGGIKTVGFNNEEAYCIWLGGKTEKKENAACSLPNGKTCLVTDLWRENSNTCL